MPRKSTPSPVFPSTDGEALSEFMARFLAFAEAQNATPEVGVEVEAKRKTAKGSKTTAKRTTAKRTTAKRTTAKRTCNITAGEAWEALGADPEFEPKDHSKPASGPMLWRLNANGQLASLIA